MVDDTKKKRGYPAPSPKGFVHFSEWLKVVTERHGQRAELGRYLEHKNIGPNVDKWINGSAPKKPSEIRKIAEWAEVSPEELRDLVDRHRENPPLKKERLVARKAAKSKRTSSQKPGRSVS